MPPTYISLGTAKYWGSYGLKFSNTVIENKVKNNSSIFFYASACFQDAQECVHVSVVCVYQCIHGYVHTHEGTEKVIKCLPLWPSTSFFETETLSEPAAC